jgi:hypothetical protein
MKQLAGHVSKKMLERYSHIRIQAKRAAIATLDEFAARAQNDAVFGGARAQNWAQPKR